MQGTYETLGSLAAQKGWGSLKGKFTLTAGLGGMGGAQPLAITMNEGVGLIVEIDPARARRRLETGYVDVVVDTLEEAMTLVEESKEKGQAKSIGLIANAADVFPELALRGVIPDVVTDQTPAHDVSMYVPHGMSLDGANKRTIRQLRGAVWLDAGVSDARISRGAEVFDYGNNTPAHLTPE